MAACCIPRKRHRRVVRRRSTGLSTEGRKKSKGDRQDSRLEVKVAGGKVESGCMWPSFGCFHWFLKARLCC